MRFERRVDVGKVPNDDYVVMEKPSEWFNSTAPMSEEITNFTKNPKR